MDTIKVILQNNKEFDTKVESYNALELTKSISDSESVIVQIGDIIVNKHHIECIHKVTN
ncbi:hypothetical protein GAG94_03680 [Lysinibacillus sphaericus]|uniref:hypothetical protein n=1 Tax=Lysinibacillus sphaericus TaxID=1421 RepID=UPI0013B091F8|nr:hypothetical protein [Lysinibacillus sphaericus]QIC46307.1 hypothetical protein GAG94_03680 [Lysinibacillus sphaericus]